MQQGPSRQAPPKPAGSRRGAAGGSAASPAGPRGLEVAELTITDAVLCSEMGVHFSPCGRYLAACVACQASDVYSYITAVSHGNELCC